MIIELSLIWVVGAVLLACVLGLFYGVLDLVLHKEAYPTPGAKMLVVLGATFWLVTVPAFLALWVLKQWKVALVKSMVSDLLENEAFVNHVTNEVEKRVAFNIGLLAEPAADGSKPRWDVSEWEAMAAGKR
jgi:hypothetical protein